MRVLIIGSLFLSIISVCFCNSVEKLNRLKSLQKPYLETYWESYLSFPHSMSQCNPNNPDPGYADVTAYGYDIKQIPSHVQVVNIAFAMLDFVSTN